MTEDRKAFAGSVATVLQCLRHLVQVVGVSLGDALRMATEAGAHYASGKPDRLAGTGRFADVLVLDRGSLQPNMVMLAGRVISG